MIILSQIHVTLAWGPNYTRRTFGGRVTDTARMTGLYRVCLQAIAKYFWWSFWAISVYAYDVLLRLIMTSRCVVIGYVQHAFMQLSEVRNGPWYVRSFVRFVYCDSPDFRVMSHRRGLKKKTLLCLFIGYVTRVTVTHGEIAMSVESIVINRWFYM